MVLEYFQLLLKSYQSQSFSDSMNTVFHWHHLPLPLLLKHRRNNCPFNYQLCLYIVSLLVCMLFTCFINFSSYNSRRKNLAKYIYQITIKINICENTFLNACNDKSKNMKKTIILHINEITLNLIEKCKIMENPKTWTKLFFRTNKKLE